MQPTGRLTSSRGAYDIEKTDVDFCVRVFYGAGFMPGERNANRGAIDAWNQNRAGRSVLVHHHPVLIRNLGITLVTLAGCVHSGANDPVPLCEAGQPCALTGRLALHEGEPVAAAVLNVGGTCAKLALPDGFLDALRQWNGQVVSIQGRAFLQPSFEDTDDVVLWYAEQGRRVPLGVCDQGIGVFVNTVALPSGETWPASPP
ncbi:hypothetical protein LDO32_10750 [Luteimonas sp. Y-2-2-4F]|nr:hypothetical protein [Luteimonas sp. Y-2-2-4F]MCD9032201.1 hypothetical protein [Luteimonas sp. Y-2-2-4F]